MPTMANLSLLNNAAAAVAMVAITPSAGDNVPAVWRIETSSPPNCRPLLSVWAKTNREKTVRTLEFKMVFPRVYTDANTGLIQTDSRATFVASLVVPQNISSVNTDDTAAFIKSMFSDSLIISCMKSQVAPT